MPTPPYLRKQRNAAARIHTAARARVSQHPTPVVQPPNQQQHLFVLEPPFQINLISSNARKEIPNRYDTGWSTEPSSAHWQAAVSMQTP